MSSIRRIEPSGNGYFSSGYEGCENWTSRAVNRGILWSSLNAKAPAHLGSNKTSPAGPFNFKDCRFVSRYSLTKIQKCSKESWRSKVQVSSSEIKVGFRCSARIKASSIRRLYGNALWIRRRPLSWWTSIDKCVILGCRGTKLFCKSRTSRFVRKVALTLLFERYQQSHCK